ncbi:tetratricopeptide repeat protein [Paludisphaera mucosa]|uniref:Tetratricopeptide repeat protein n=1 Tax=Paludisphaera mucosa TaxID=3030827 RepID=A0ABT6F6I7_9BACT|nr:hypothetical protein [Paludisphaera mucosa]MDG3003203.1 hypothetical protein [Paludisphaera mucosa]
MTRPDASSPVPDKKRDRDDADLRHGGPVPEGSEPLDADAEPEPQPEPWTPERVTEWNAYYDLYVLGAALLLTFVASFLKTNHAPLWSNLKVGREIIARGTPLVADAFSYTEEGKTWVNVPWLFQAASAGLYNAAYSLVPEAPDDPTANRASAEQIATGALVALTAFLRLATAFVLIKIRHKGPGLWWAALCTALALGAVFGPAGLMLGGIAQPAVVGPSTWGDLFLALELFLLFRAFGQSRAGALYALVPLFLVWANVDESFLFGLLILASAVLGKFLDGRGADVEAGAPIKAGEETPRPPVSAGFATAILLASALIVLLNPSHIRIYPAALEPVTSFFSSDAPPPTLDQLSYFGRTIRSLYPGAWHWLALFYVVFVGLGAASFVVNVARFSWARFLPFVFAAFAWAVYTRYSAGFAMVLAAVAALNGQEWYQRRFGVTGRLGSGWTLWSTGGRLVSLAALFGFVAVAITGYGKSKGDQRFGFGFDPDDFAFKAAEYLAAHDDIKGNVFNWNSAQGDAVVWKAGPTRKSFVDNRANLFPNALLEQHRTLLNALRDDDPAIWKPLFDEHKISTVMIDADSARNTYRRLFQSPNWIPFYDDGQVVMFGRSDAAEPDVATFRANRLDPELRAYKIVAPTPAADRPPTPVDFIDDFLQSRSLTPPRSQTNAARRWLGGGLSADGSPAPPDPARCLLAIREARSALAQNPDDYTAYRLLSVAYRALAQQEAAVLSGIALTPENRERIAAIKPGGTLMSERLRQLVTALNYAVQTSPPPHTQAERQELMSVQYELYDAFLQLGFVDLAREQLRALLATAKPGDLASEPRLQYQALMEQLNQQVAQIEQAVSNLQIERQAGPIELGQYALSQGAAGLAITQFEDANRSNLSPTVVKPRLLDLYCSTGQPERALEVIAPSGAADPNLGDSALAPFRQGLVYKLMGNYSYATMLWQTQAVPRLAFDRTSKAIGIAGRSMRGDLVGAANDGGLIPEQVSRQANWEFDLAQCLLEWGEPERAAEHYTQALELVPDLALRPLITYYLEKIGKPVPAKKAEAPSPEPAKPAADVPIPDAAFKAEEPKSEAAKADEPKPAEPKVETPKAEAEKKP